jgi:hypothetical protein
MGGHKSNHLLLHVEETVQPLHGREANVSHYYSQINSGTHLVSVLAIPFEVVDGVHQEDARGSNDKEEGAKRHDKQLWE